LLFAEKACSPKGPYHENRQTNPILTAATIFQTFFFSFPLRAWVFAFPTSPRLPLLFQIHQIALKHDRRRRARLVQEIQMYKITTNA
jgi:hypothetical protein